MQAITPEIIIDDQPSRLGRKYPGYYLRKQIAKLLRRHKDTLNRWDALLRMVHPDYKRLSLGSRKPWHPFQVELLKKISDYQFRTNDPRTNRDTEEIIKFIDLHAASWTEENWKNNNYQLPDYDNNQKAS